jgi:hypothetical protein
MRTASWRNVREGVWKRSETTDNGYRIYTYENNYNVALNKCYMIIKTTTHGRGNKSDPPYDVIDKELRDVNSNRQIGYIVYLTGQPPSPGFCEVANRPCQSSEEWDTLAAPFMGW